MWRKLRSLKMKTFYLNFYRLFWDCNKWIYWQLNVKEWWIHWNRNGIWTISSESTIALKELWMPSKKKGLDRWKKKCFWSQSWLQRTKWKKVRKTRNKDRRKFWRWKVLKKWKSIELFWSIRLYRLYMVL